MNILSCIELWVDKQYTNDINTDMSYLMQKGVPSAGLGKGILSVTHLHRNVQKLGL
jgi:hypothetical protein